MVFLDKKKIIQDLRIQFSTNVKRSQPGLQNISFSVLWKKVSLERHEGE